jgi:HEAT repeat protein
VARADTAAAQPTIVDLIEHDHSTAVQVTALGLYDPRVAPPGTTLLVDRVLHGGTLAIRQVAAGALLKKPDAAGAAALEAATGPDERRSMRTQALAVLAKWPDKKPLVEVATRSLADGDPLFAVAAAQQLGMIGDAASRTALQSALATEKRVTVRAAITAALAGKM